MAHKVIIIEDEENFLADLKQKLRGVVFDLELCGTAVGVKQAVELIATSKPHVILLDYELVDGTAQDIMPAVPKNTKVIMTTKFNNLGSWAYTFESIVAYVDKPIQPEALNRALSRACGRATPTNTGIHELMVRTNLGMQPVVIEQIRYIEGVPNKTMCTAHLQGGQRKEIHDLLSGIDRDLKDKGFVRIHKSFIINEHYLRAVTVEQVLLKDSNEPIPIGKAGKDWALSYMNRGRNKH